MTCSKDLAGVGGEWVPNARGLRVTGTRHGTVQSAAADGERWAGAGRAAVSPYLGALPNDPWLANSLRLVTPALAAIVLHLATPAGSNAATWRGDPEVGGLNRTIRATGTESSRTGPFTRSDPAGGTHAVVRTGTTDSIEDRRQVEATNAGTAFVEVHDVTEPAPAAPEQSGTGPPTYRRIRYANGDRYEGEVEGGAIHGRGTYTWADGDRYEGEWRDGRRHGWGAYIWADGNVYVGGWRDGRRHGDGTYTWADGDRIESRWNDGRRHLPGADCLMVEKITKRMALWINRCQVGIDVVWRDQGTCRSQATDAWPCSWYVGAYGSEKAAIEGQVWWRECKSPQGPGDVAAVEKEQGNVYCVDRSGPRTSARTTQKRERAARNVQAAEESTETEIPPSTDEGSDSRLPGSSEYRYDRDDSEG